MRKLTAPLSREDALSLRAGEHILLSGTVYTARDAAHLRMLELLRRTGLRPRTETLGFEEIPAGLARLMDGEILGKLVVTFD